MKQWAALGALLLAAGWHGPVAFGQGVTVQLPTYRTFRTTTTVSVPDRGGIYMGGVNGARSSRHKFGSPVTPGGVAIGSARQAAGLHVSAYIHDHQEMDRQLLGAAGTADVDKDRLAERFADSAGNRPPPSVAETLARQQAANATRLAEAEACFQRGLDAVATGKPGVARVHLQMAARRASGELKQRILTELDRLNAAVAAKIDR